MLPFAPLPTLIISTEVPLMLSCDPASTIRESAAAAEFVKIAPPAACRYTVVVPETWSFPMVCDGTFVAVVVAPLLNKRMSSLAGVVRAGVQLEGVVQEAEPVWFQV